MDQDLSYLQTKAALYISRLLEANIIAPEYTSFYHYLNAAGVNLKELLRNVIDAVKSKPNSSSKSEALEELHQAEVWSASHLQHDFDDIYRDNPGLREPIRSYALTHCRKISQVTPYDVESYTLARKNLAEIFSLSNEAQEFLEVEYIRSIMMKVDSYFDNALEVYRPHNRKKLAVLLGMTASEIISARHELHTCRLLEGRNFRGISLSDTVPKVYDMLGRNLSELFCAPLNGDTLPLDNFSIAHEDLSYITQLLTARPPHRFTSCSTVRPEQTRQLLPEASPENSDSQLGL